MAFKKSETGIEGLWLIEPGVAGDDRGWFMESWSAKAFDDLGLPLTFLQDNISFSRKGTLRGLHFQAPPFAQGKLVSVVQGAVLDAVVDIRRKSKTYGRSYAVKLSAENHAMLYVPPGFAHGFLVLSETCLFMYKCTSLYNRASEGGLLWNDPSLGIDWGVSEPLLSAKDQVYVPFTEFQSPFE